MATNNIPPNWEEQVIALQSFPGFLELCALRFETTNIRKLHKTYKVQCAECNEVISYYALEELLKYLFVFKSTGKILPLNDFGKGEGVKEILCRKCGHKYIKILYDPYEADPEASTNDFPDFEDLMKSL